MTQLESLTMDNMVSIYLMMKLIKFPELKRKMDQYTIFHGTKVEKSSLSSVALCLRLQFFLIKKIKRYFSLAKSIETKYIGEN